MVLEELRELFNLSEAFKKLLGLGGTILSGLESAIERALGYVATYFAIPVDLMILAGIGYIIGQIMLHIDKTTGELLIRLAYMIGLMAPPIFIMSAMVALIIMLINSVSVIVWPYWSAAAAYSVMARLRGR